LLVLDTDHFSELERDLEPGKRLTQRLNASALDKAVTVITIEEVMRGWLAEISRHDPPDQITPYSKLQRQFETFANWIILPWDADSADLFINFRRQGLRIGSLDLKIACIALAHDALLLTRNIRDFSAVAGLKAENWLD
jgi:Predicted nucleic acid-binding protein, contains PIN domain